MPVLAIAAIAGAGAVAAQLITAATLSYVGIGLSVVGKITKSKELSQIGAGLGLGAGLSSLFGGLTNAASAGTELVGSAASPVSEAGFDAFAASQGAAESAVGLDAFGGATPSFETAGLGSQAGSTGLIGAAPAPIATQVPSFDAISASAPGQVAAPFQAPLSAPVAASGVVAPPPPDTSPFGIKSWFAGLSDAQKNNVLTIGGKAAEGLFAGYSADQRNAIERERFNLERERVKTQNTNANAQPVVSFKPVGLMAAAGGR